MTNQTPEISIIVPIYNGEKFLEETLKSIFSSTFKNFEVIAVNDGSKDRSLDILKACTDPRLRYFDQANQGLSKTLNFGVSQARAPLIARLDHDDIMLPQRLEIQKKYIDAHPNVGLVGAVAEIITEDGKPTGRFLRHPRTREELLFWFQFDCYMVHSCVMFRKKIWSDLGEYTTDPNRQPQDFDMWSKMLRVCDVENLPDVLVKYRESSNSMSRDHRGDYARCLELLGTDHAFYLQKAAGRKNVDENLVHLYYRITQEGAPLISLKQAFALLGIHWGAIWGATVTRRSALIYSPFWTLYILKHIVRNLTFMKPVMEWKRKMRASR